MSTTAKELPDTPDGIFLRWEKTEIDGVEGVCAYTREVDEYVGVLIAIEATSRLIIGGVETNTQVYFVYYFDHVDECKTWEHPFNPRRAHSTMVFSKHGLQQLKEEVDRMTAELPRSGNAAAAWIEALYGISPAAFELADLITAQGDLAMATYISAK